jgi:8-oxo-dGTP pyrophosphatase MutT (NUDIX family)
VDEPESLRRSPKYRLWKKTLEESGCALREAELLQELTRKDGSLLFALLRTRVEDPEGRPLPAYAFIRGPACLIVTVVVNRDTGLKKFLMLRQRRIAHGRDTLEFPAGMLDGDVHDPLGVAVREVLEETGLEVKREDLVPLCDRALYTSPGLDDEAIHYFACTLTLPGDRFAALEGGETGLAEEHEYIRLGLWDYPEALKEIDALQVRLAFHLYFEKFGRPQ